MRSRRGIAHRAAGQLHDEIEESADLGGRMMPRRVERVERKPFVGPVGKEVDQLAAREPLFGSGRENLCDAMATETLCVHRADVIDHQAAARLDDDLLPSPMKFPRIWTSRLRFAEIEAHVRLAFEVRGCERASRSPDVRG